MKISKKRGSSRVSSATSGPKYGDAIDFIRKAIDSLGRVSKEDAIARDAIANLSVVLLDIKSQQGSSM